MPKGYAKLGFRKITNRKNDPRITSAKKVHRDNHYKKKGLSFELFLELSQKPCFYCGTEKCSHFNTFESQRKSGVKVSDYAVQNGNFYYNGIDKINHEEIYREDNIVTCCKKCNWMKQRLFQNEFLEHIKIIYEFLHLDSMDFKHDK